MVNNIDNSVKSKSEKHLEESTPGWERVRDSSSTRSSFGHKTGLIFEEVSMRIALLVATPFLLITALARSLRSVVHSMVSLATLGGFFGKVQVLSWRSALADWYKVTGKCFTLIGVIFWDAINPTKAFVTNKWNNPSLSVDLIMPWKEVINGTIKFVKPIFNFTKKDVEDFLGGEAVIFTD